MKLNYRKYFAAALLLGLPLAFTSCEGALDDIFGEWDKPAANNNTNPCTDSTPAPLTTYLKWNGTDALVATPLPESFKKMSASETTWSGTYIVDEDIVISGDVTFDGDVDLIILDGKTLSLPSDKKINYMGSTYTLNIYSQSKGDGAGKLTLITTSTPAYYPLATNGTINIHSGIVNSTATGGGNEGIYAPTLNIYGGKVVATATSVAIKAGDLNIYNGADVKATSSGADGIQAYTSLTISGDDTKVYATGFKHGIYGQGSSTTVTINGGSIFGKATGDGATDYGIEGIISYKGGVVEGEGGTNATSFGFGGQFYNNSGAAINVGTKSNPADAWTSTPLNNGYCITAFNKYMIMPMP